MEGKQLALFLCSVIIGVISTTIVGLRCMTRFMIGGIWLDDWLMIVAQALTIAIAISACIGAAWGIGVPDADFTRANQSEQTRFMIFLIQLLYGFAVIFVKSSICFAIYRITVSKEIRSILWALIILSTATGLLTVCALMGLCDPISEIWTYVPTGHCRSTMRATIKAVVITSTVSAIITDFGCAIVPYVVLWDLQMPKKTKISIAALLGLSFIACAATIVRVQYIPDYYALENFAYGFADPYMWVLVELGIGTTMGSVPALKPLVKRAGIFSSLRSRHSAKRTGLGGAAMGNSIQLQSQVAQSISQAPERVESDTYKLLSGDRGFHKEGVISVVTTGV